MDRGHFSKALKACAKYAEYDLSLWTAALAFFAARPEPCEDEIVQVLDQIEQYNLMPPLAVLQLLARNPNKPVSVVKRFLIRALEHESSVIANDQEEIARYQVDTQAMRADVEGLRTRPTVFKEIDCHRCTNSLTLPAVHFLCMHSFHQNCVADSDRECPICAPDHRKVRDMKLSLRQSAVQHDRFFKQLADSADGFATVAEYFGRGALDHLGQPTGGPGAGAGAGAGAGGGAGRTAGGR